MWIRPIDDSSQWGKSRFADCFSLRRRLSVYAIRAFLMAAANTLVSRFVLGLALAAHPRRCFGKAHESFEHGSP
jgi:hypothetical protein